jgi:hypothetical protein
MGSGVRVPYRPIAKFSGKNAISTSSGRLFSFVFRGTDTTKRAFGVKLCGIFRVFYVVAVPLKPQSHLNRRSHIWGESVILSRVICYISHLGQARVRIDGEDIYLGPHDSDESRQKYYRLLSERFGDKKPIAEIRKLAPALTIAEFLKSYCEFGEGYYGKESGEHYRIKSAIRPLLDLYGLELEKEFSPLKLQTALDRLVLNGDTRKEIIAKSYRTISRTTVNDYLTVIKRIFQWGVSQELVPVAVFQSLTTVNGIRKGRGTLATKTHDPRKVTPVPQSDYEAVLAIGGLSDEIKAMLELQNLTGMRPGEVTIMRPCDIDQKVKPCWVYRPSKHKNDWREGMKEKEVQLGPRAQKLLKPWIKKCKRDTDFFIQPESRR